MPSSESEEKMLLYTLPTGEEVHRYHKSIVIEFGSKKRKVLSTSALNGGLRNDLTAVYNNDVNVGAGMAITLKAPTLEEHMVILCKELGIDPEKTAGLGTAAYMENVSIKSSSYKDITVTAIVTGGVEVNGGRVGDPASWDELANYNILTEPRAGTINIILHINVALTNGAITRSVVTCTEAKTAALQELMAPSRYSSGLATGSGTDGTIIVSNSESDIVLSDAGKHCKLGELIGTSVKAAVKEALYKQTGISPERQHNVLARTDRYLITEQALWDAYKGPMNKAHFVSSLETRLSESDIVTKTAVLMHLLDEVSYGLLTEDEIKPEAYKILEPYNAADPDKPVLENLKLTLLKLLEDETRPEEEAYV
jgi:adenosylcobinamide amidohydrolase